MKRCRPLFAAIVLCLPLSSYAADKVEFTHTESEITITIGGKEFTRFETGEKWKKPFFHPVFVNGTDITRPVDPNEKEHPHHKGIWVSIDEVDEIKFWAEKGIIRNQRTMFATDLNTGIGEMTIVNHWLGDDGAPVVEETTIVRIHPNRLMTFDINFTTQKDEVVFDDTKEGLLGFRMAQSMRESEGGTAIGADGAKGTAALWGKPNKWIDYYGKVNDKVFGVALMDHPENLRPSRYHVRNYGLFSLSPFGEKSYTNGQEEAKPYHLKPGEKLKLRYAIYFHTGDTAEGHVEAVYQQFVGKK